MHSIEKSCISEKSVECFYDTLVKLCFLGGKLQLSNSLSELELAIKNSLSEWLTKKSLEDLRTEISRFYLALNTLDYGQRLLFKDFANNLNITFADHATRIKKKLLNELDQAIGNTENSIRDTEFSGLIDLPGIREKVSKTASKQIELLEAKKPRIHHEYDDVLRLIEAKLFEFSNMGKQTQEDFSPCATLSYNPQSFELRINDKFLHKFHKTSQTRELFEYIYDKINSEKIATSLSDIKNTIAIYSKIELKNLISDSGFDKDLKRYFWKEVPESGDEKIFYLRKNVFNRDLSSSEIDKLKQKIKALPEENPKA